MSRKKRELMPQVPGQVEAAPVAAPIAELSAAEPIEPVAVIELAAAVEPVVIEPVVEPVPDEPIAAAPAAPVAPAKAVKKGFDDNGIAHAAKGRIPEPHEVDPRLIKRATLTTQGYIVPVK